MKKNWTGPYYVEDVTKPEGRRRPTSLLCQRHILTNKSP
jgi:hypothetical protein